MKEAMKVYRAKLLDDRFKHQEIVSSMQSGRLQSFELDSAGNRTECTSERIRDHESLIQTLNEVIAAIDRGDFG
ncbi:hypothetical protein BJF91_16990 [Allorhizobium taibaishanense]|uniref:Uncharacterized protein n=1 Tax=Allorhizobium taibaishanense TaxID=887144 RepID=A0A1Q9A2L8_9HYPH|nr:hypothetical protein BJF91_16990 [Allorhizobium taibaishanense]